MTILGLISYRVFPAQMGGQKGIAEWYEFLSRKEKVVIVGTKENTVPTFSFQQWYSFLENHNSGWRNILHIRKLLHLIRVHKVDVIIIEHSYFGWIGLLLHLITGKPFLIHSHNIEAHRFKITGKKWWKIYEVYERWIHSKARLTLYKCEEDAAYVKEQWKLKQHLYCIIPFGTRISAAPSQEEKKEARKKICAAYNIDPSSCIFLFNGTLDFSPNVSSINIILHQLIPYLRNKNFNYRIIISGNRADAAMLKELTAAPEIIFTGFVDDISLLLKGADAFINPSSAATGIKTKLVEALANNTSVICSRSSARGLHHSYLTNKVQEINDNDIIAFAEAMINIPFNNDSTIAASFYKNFYWGNIIDKALLSLRSL
ncbi:MAG: glycosyltransferase family 4 protein [Bacteroidota bacterium]|nr:glycosyltransferase family 4 protein [Bacteroidota bacterium]